MEDRTRLPFRVNCEGYFTDGRGNVLARDSGDGYLVLPGGGIDQGEGFEEGILRETKEETGAIIIDLKEVSKINFIWSEKWATTEKQRKRYLEYQGEEMHFFTGRISGFDKAHENEEDFWQGDKLMPITKAIEMIENNPHGEEIKEYREMQIKFLRKLLGEK